MSVAAVMMVKDEADILDDVLEHLSWHVDAIYVIDNLSTDGTALILDAAAKELNVTWEIDQEIGYWQSAKMTTLARRAMADGHQWVLPVDADEIWSVAGEPDRRIRDWLAGMAPDVIVVQAAMFNHVPTGKDPERDSPLDAIGWRQRHHAPLPKVACRLHESLIIEPGNHGATYAGVALAVSGLEIRHFSWRSPEQYVRKIRNGIAAYAATDYPETVGLHWQMWRDAYEQEGSTLGDLTGWKIADIGNHDRAYPADLALMDHFRTWFYSPHPEQDASLILDPARRRVVR